MNHYVFLFGVFLTFAAVKNGEALQCWECTSNEGGSCADYFNTTRYPRSSSFYSAVSANNNPRLTTCSSSTGYGFQREVCMKRVEIDKRFQRTTYIRQCHTLLNDERPGPCQKQLTHNDVSIEFCEYCDTHECNGAPKITTNVLCIGFISIALSLFLRK